MRAGSNLLIQGLLLRNAVLPSRQLVDSGRAAPAPLAFNLSSGNSGNSSSSSNLAPATLFLDGCTVSSSCSNLAQFASWLVSLTAAVADVEVVQVCLCAAVPYFSYQTACLPACLSDRAGPQGGANNRSE